MVKISYDRTSTSPIEIVCNPVLRTMWIWVHGALDMMKICGSAAVVSTEVDMNMPAKTFADEGAL
jgi:hypothetical protein